MTMVSWQCLVAYQVLIIVYLLIQCYHKQACGKLVLTSSTYTCPGGALTYECTVTGRRVGSTVWRGTAFNCTNDEIVLQHKRFPSENGGVHACNNGLITAQSLTVDEEQRVYTSQLSVNVTDKLIGKSIECVHDNVSDSTIVGSVNITDEFEVSYQTRRSWRVHIAYVNTLSRIITLNWTKFVPDCPSIHYTILSSNCGNCPTTTTNTTVTCTDVPFSQNEESLLNNTTLCNFSVESNSSCCGYISAASTSHPLHVFLFAERNKEPNKNIRLSDDIVVITLIAVNLFTFTLLAVSTGCCCALIMLLLKRKAMYDATRCADVVECDENVAYNTGE